MAHFGRTWWGKRFIEALEGFTDAARLGRGRSYAHNGRILEYQIANGKVIAKVRGSINPYFGVYEEPMYKTSVTVKQISSADWTKLIADLSSKAGYITKLLLNEMPNTIEEAFAGRRLALLPHGEDDFKTSCSCPDFYNPCKHIAGVCYLLASALDRDPFLMFELRGLSRDQLRAELARSPLGQILASELAPHDASIEPAPSYYTTPVKEPAGTASSLKEFWTGARRLPSTIDLASPSSVSALVVKKQGDYPSFWPKDQSFIGVMEELYERVRTKSRQLR